MKLEDKIQIELIQLVNESMRRILWKIGDYLPRIWITITIKEIESGQPLIDFYFRLLATLHNQVIGTTKPWLGRTTTYERKMHPKNTEKGPIGL